MAQRAPALWRELLLATTCLVVASPLGHAASQPTGFTVAGGQGSVSAPNPTTTLIRQSTDKAIFEWSSFSTSRGFSVVFQQPGSGSIALNRIRGPGATQFDGSLQANGQVWIVNPNGVFFGQGAQINVGGLIATTADIRNQDFLSGNYSFSGASGAAIVNEGQIRAASGGSVILAGTHVRNDGLIQADLGTVQLAAGKSFAVDLNGDKLIRFQVTAAVDQTPLDANGRPVDALITNSGTLSAAGGKVLLTARAAKGIVDNVINTTGIVEATSVRQVNGEIVLDGGDGGAVKVAGSLDASGKQAGETGGTALVAGGAVGLLDNARIDVSGDAGGGTALIGGGAHGVGPLLNADTTLVAGGATIAADASTRGDGGNVVVWSDRYTAVAGSISARGGSVAGNGGFVETSSHGDLRIASSARVAVDARKGKSGQWLLDPRNATIGNSSFGGTSDTSGNSIIGIPTSDDASIAASVIDAALNSGTSVTLTTGSTGLQAGNITVAAAVAKTGGGDATLTLNAAGGITVGQSITSSAGALSVNLVAGTNVLVNAGIVTNGGNFTANGAQFANSAAISTIAAASANGNTSLSAVNGMTIGGTILTGQFTATVTGTGGAFALAARAKINATGRLDVSNLGGSLNVGGALIGNGITLSAGSFVQIATGTIASTGNNFGSNDLSISADSISLSGADRSITGNGTITLAPLSDSTTVGIGTASGQFHLTNSEGNVFDGFQQFIVGKADQGTAGNHGTASLTLGGALTFDNQALVFQAGLNGAVTLAPDAAITLSGHKLTFATGAGGSFTQSNGATLTALANTQVRIGADAIALNGPVGSLSGLGQVELRGATNTTTIGVGTVDTGAGTLNISQVTIDRLSHFAVLGIGDGDNNTGLVTIGGAVNLGTTTGFGGRGTGASVMLNADAHITTSAPSGSAVGFFSGTGGSVTQTSGATINAGASTLVIAADEINLAGPPGSLSGAKGVIIAAGHGGDNTMSVGTGGGALVVTQGLIDNLQSFSSLTLGGLPALLPVSGALDGTPLVTVGGAITARIATTIAAAAPGGQVVLQPGTSLNSAGKAIGFLGAVVLGGVDATTGTTATIDTTNGGGTPAGGAISFGGTVDGSFGRQQSLALTAGGDDITFNDTVGQALNHGAFQLGDVTINSVRNFTTVFTAAAAAAGQQFVASSFTLANGTGAVSMPTGLRTRFNNDQTVATTAKSISITTSGAVTIGSFNSDPNLVTGITTRGSDSTLAGSVAGSGGAVSITGSSITLPGYLVTRGGNVSGTASGNAGNMGAISLNATNGDVVVGIDNNNNAFNRGGDSLNGSGGNAASFTINAAGSIILPGGVGDRGGNAGGNFGYGGNAGALSLTATTGNIVIGSAVPAQSVSTSGGAAAAYGGAALGTGGTGNAISMNAGGSVTVYGPVQTSGGQGTQSGDSSGALTVVAGGNVNLGFSSSSAPAVNTSGHATALNNGGTGNAGAINITGANIFLLNGASANGGNSTPTAAAKGGDAAPINLTATNGLVLVGRVGSGPGSAGNLTLSAVGGFSGSGNGGAGADVAVSSATMLLAGIETAGGGTVIGGGHPGGKAGKITLTASASLGDAVVLFGQDAAGGIRGTLDASGGAGADEGHKGQSGTITIQGSAAGAALNGSADIRLQVGSNPATHQGSRVVINGGTVNLNGPIVGTTTGVETLTINGTSTPIGLATPLVLTSVTPYGAVTAASAVFAGGTVTASDIFITGASTLSGSTAIDTSAANGVIALGPVNAASAGAQSLTLTAGSGFVVLGDSIGNTTALGNFSATGGSVLLPGTIKTAGGTVTIGGAAVLQNSLAIDTTNAGASSGGATITFTGTLDGLMPRADNLTLTAGLSGDINFNGRVGVNNIGLGNTGFDPNGARLGDVQINGAHNVNLNMAFGTNGDGFTANSFAIGTTSAAGAATLTSSSFIAVKPNNGTPGVITINTTGDVSVAQGLGANGSFNPGDPGGNVTVISGGNVSIGTALVPSFNSNFSINARGADTTAANQPAGHGGTVVVTAKSINLPGGVLARGGDSKFAGNSATSAGGAGGSITLTATAGNVTVGTASSGTAFSASARGGNSQSGSGGAGGTVSISGTTLFLTGAFAQGGDTLVNAAGAGGAGGNITLTASAASGDAVVIYGNSSAPGATSFGTVLSRGGQIGVTSLANGTSPEVGGTVDGAGGDITIQGGPSLTPLSGVVRLATSADTGALNGGSSVLFSSSGGTAAAYGGAALGAGGTTRILGAIVGTTVNTENLRFGAQNGTVIIDGPIGSVTPLSTLAIGGNGSTVNFGAVSLGTAFLDQRSSGSVAFGGMLTTPDLTMAPGSTVALALNGGTNITDRLTLSGTVSAGALLLNIPTTLVGDTTINATAGGGSLGLGSIDGTHILALSASGAVSLGTVGAENPLAALNVSGSSIALGSVFTQVGQNYTGATTIAANSTLASLGGPISFSSNVVLGGVDASTASLTRIATTGGGLAPNGAMISFGGTVDGSFAGRQGLAIDAGAGGANLGGVGTTTALGNLAISGAMIGLGSVTTAGAQSYSGGMTTIGANAALTTSGGAVTFNSGVTLAGIDGTTATVTAIDTTNGGAAPGGAAITFRGTVDGGFSRRQGLTLAAGSSGDVSFAQRVGDDGLGTLGTVRLGDFTVTSARDVTMSVQEGVSGDGFRAGSISITGIRNFVVNSYLRTAGFDNRNDGSQNAGNITIVASGAVKIATIASPNNFSSLSTRGGDALLGDSIAGNAGNISVTAASINLPDGVFARGGNATIATVNGGAGGSISLIATGAVSAGTDGQFNNSTRGGNSAGGSGGTGGNFAATGTSITLAGGAQTRGGDVSSASGGQGGNAGTLTLTATAGDIVGGSDTNTNLAARGGNSNGTAGGNAAPINISATGAVNVPGGIAALGGNGGGNAAAVTINAGGSVSLGTSGTPSNSSFSVVARGGDAFKATQTPGNGAAISIAGSDVNLPLGVFTRGGDGAVAGPNGGNAGSITLTAANGNVAVGSAGSGTEAYANARGGNSLGGTAGSGANIAVSGRTMSLAGATSQGGDTTGATAGSADNAGNIVLTATATSGDAVTLYGNSLSPGTYGVLVARGGRTGVTSFATDTTSVSGGTTVGIGGNITIQGGPGGAALNGTSDLRLATSTAPSLSGGGNILIINAGGTSAGAITIAGPIVAHDLENLSLNAGSGTATVGGVIGSIYAPNTLTLAGNGSIVTFQEAVTLASAFTDTRGSGSVTFNSDLTAPTITTAPGVTTTILGSSGAVNASLAGVMTVSSLVVTGTTTLTANTTIDTSGTGGTVSLGAVDGISIGGQSLTINAGSGGVALRGPVGANDALASVTVTGGLVTLGTVTTTGAQSYTGPTTLAGNALLTTKSGAVTFNSPLVLAGIDAATGTIATIDTTNGGGAPGGAAISFGGTVDGSFGRKQALTLAAGHSDIAFNDTVGGGVQLGNFTASSVRNFTAALTAAAAAIGQPFSVASFGLAGSGSVTMSGLRTRFGDNQTVATTSGAINISTTGAVSIGAFNSDPNLVTGVQARGADATTIGSVAGSGGTISITGSSINLTGFVQARGGSVSGTASGNAGNMGAVTLTATSGDVVAGIDANNGAFMRGGDSVSGSGGNAAPITINAAGSIILPGGIAARGGNAGGASGNGGNAGALNLTATTGNIVIGGAATTQPVTTSGGNAAVAAAYGGAAAVGTGGAAAAMTMNAGGSVVVYGPIQTSGGQGTQSGDSSGALTIVAGGNVSLGSTASFTPAVNTGGHFAAVANEGTGNAGAIKIDGANIFLLNGVQAGGGNYFFGGGTAGGNAAPITLTANNGLILIGTPNSGPGANGSSITASAVGGNSNSANGGSGADITITGGSLLLSGVQTTGGANFNGFVGGNAGNITLTATASIGDAVVLFGQEAKPSSFISPTLDASGGFTPSASGHGGNITIQGGAGGVALNGTADIRLQASGADHSNTTTHVGTAVVISNFGSTSGAVNLHGAIVGTNFGVETLTINGASTPIGTAATLNLTAGNYGVVTAASASFSGGTVHANDIFITGGATLAGSTTIDTSSGNGVISFGRVDDAAAGSQSLTLTAGAGTVVLGSLGSTAALGNLSVSGGSVQLGGNITTGGSVTIGGAAVLRNSIAIDTTNGGFSPGGATINFTGTLDGMFSRGQNLTLTAGSTGDVNFSGRVGVNNRGSGNSGDVNGVRLGDVSIRSARNVGLATPFGATGDGFAANSLKVETTSATAGAASFAASSYINTNGAGGGSASPDGGAVTIRTTGDITIARNIAAGGSFNPPGGNLAGVAGRGGDVKLISGGTVTVNTTDTPAQLGFNRSTFSISANGFDANTTGIPGDGGSVVISAANINLPLGVFARGGDAQVSGANGGAGGTITLTATGNISVGSLGSGTIAAASVRGGASVTGTGGAGGAISISGNTMLVTSANARGGDTQAATGGGNAGSISLTGTATSGDAITLVGIADPNASATLSARGGRNNVIFTTAGTSGGTTAGAGGTITIAGGANGAPLNGSSDVRLVSGTAPALGGGAIVSMTAAGGTSGGTILIAGPVNASTSNIESLRLSAQLGNVTVTGPIGGAMPLDTLTLAGNFSRMSFQGPVTLGTGFTDSRAFGGATFGQLLTVPSLTMAPGAVALGLQGGAAISSGATLSGVVTAATLTIGGPTLLVGDTVIDSTGANGALALGTVDGAYALALNAGSGAVTLGTVGGVTPLASLTVDPGSIGLASVTTTGSQIYTGATTIAAGATLTTAGSSVTFNGAVKLGGAGPSTDTTATIDTTNGGSAPAGGAIAFSGPVDASFDGRQGLALNAGSSTVSFNGALGSGTRLAALDLTAGSGTAINQAVFTAGATTLTAGGGAGLSVGTGVAGTLMVDNTALSHIISGSLQLQTTGSGAITVDGVTAAATAHTGAVTLASAGVTDFVNHASNFAGALTVSNGDTMTLAAGASLTASGGFAQNGAGAVTLADNLTTTNQAINFTSAITLAGPVALSSGGGAITLPAIAGAQSLAVDAGSGALILNGPIGSGAALTSLALTSGNAGGIVLPSIRAGTVSVSAGGALTQAAGTAVVAAGTVLSAGSDNDITLVNSGNDFDQGGGAATLVVTSGRNVQLRDANALQLGNVTASGTLVLSTSGPITQAAGTALVAAGTTLAAGGSDITLVNSGNDFDRGDGAVPLAVTNGWHVQIRDANSLQLGNVTAFGTLSLATGGPLVQVSGTSVNAVGTTLAAGSGNDIMLANAGNSFTGGEGGATLAVTSGHNVQLRDANALQLGNVTVSGRFALTTGGPMTQAAGTAVVAAGTTLAAGGSDITLANTGNDFDAGGGAATLTVTSGNNVTVRDQNALQLGNVVTSGTLSVTTGGALTQASGTSVNAVGTRLAAGSGNDITLANGGNSFTGGEGGATLAVASGRNVQLNDAGSLQLGNVTASGMLSVTTGGTLTQSSGTSVNAVGTTLAAGSTHDITLVNTGNDFDQGGGAATLAVTSGRNVQLRDANALQLGNVTVLGTLSVTTGGTLTQASGTAMSAVGTRLAVGSGHDIVLANTGNDFDVGGGTATLAVASGNNVTVRDQNALQLGDVAAFGTLSVTSNGVLTQASGTSVSAAGTTLAAGSGNNNDITLANVGNSFTGGEGGATLSVTSGRNVQLRDAGSLVLGNIAAYGTLSVTTGGALTQASGTSVNAVGTTLAAGIAHDITLFNAGNDFDLVGGGAATLAVTSGRNVQLRDANALQLSNVTASGTLAVTTGGALTQASGTAVNAGSTTLAAGSANNITLANAGNSFSGAEGGTLTVTSGKAVQIRNAGALQLGNVTASSTLSVTTGGAITQAAGTSVIASGTTLAAGSGNDITLANTGNDFDRSDGNSVTTVPIVTICPASVGSPCGGSPPSPPVVPTISTPPSLVVLSGKNVQLRDANGLQLGNVTTSGNLSVRAGSTLINGVHVEDLPTSGSVTVGGAFVTVTPSGTSITAPGNLTILSGGSLTQAEGTSLSVSGSTSAVATVPLNLGLLTSVTAGGSISITTTSSSINLTQSGNIFGGPVSLTSSGDAALKTSGALALGTVSVPGALTLSYAGTLALPTALTVGSLNTLGGAVSLAGAVATTGGAMQLGAVTLTADSILTTNGGDLTTGTINGAQTLTINPGAGTVAINGTIGGIAKPTGLVLNGSGAATIASVTALGLLDLSGKTAGSLTFPGSVNIDSLTTSANPYSIAFNNGGTIGDPIFSNTGTLTITGLMNVLGGLGAGVIDEHGFVPGGPSSTYLNGILASDDNPILIHHLVVTGDSAIVSGTGAIVLGPVAQGAHSLVITGGGTGLNADLFFGPWTGTGVRLVQPGTVGASVGLAGAAGDFTIDANSLQVLASGGPSQVKIGRDDFNDTLTANAFTFDAPLMLFGSNITLAGVLTKNVGALTLQAGGAFGQSSHFTNEESGASGVATGTLNLAPGTGILQVAAAKANFTNSTVNGASGADAALAANVALTKLGAGPFLMNGVSFPATSTPVVTPPPPQPLPKTVQPSPPPPQVVDVPPPPPAPPTPPAPPPAPTVAQPDAPPPAPAPTPALVQALGGEAQAAAALANVVPQAGSGTGTTDTGSSTPTENDKLTQTISQPLTNQPPSQPAPKKPSTTSVVINGMLNKFQPSTSAPPPSGTTPGGQNFSSWGNEAFW